MLQIIHKMHGNSIGCEKDIQSSTAGVAPVKAYREARAPHTPPTALLAHFIRKKLNTSVLELNYT